MFHMLFCVIFTGGQPKINIAILINTRCGENKTIFFLSPTSITKVDCLYSRSIANKTKWCKREMRKKWRKNNKKMERERERKRTDRLEISKWRRLNEAVKKKFTILSKLLSQVGSPWVIKTIKWDIEVKLWLSNFNERSS